MNALRQILAILRVLWVFTPSLLCFALLMLACWEMEEGRDLFIIAGDTGMSRGLTTLAAILLAFVLWYPARLVGFTRLHWLDVNRVTIAMSTYMPRCLGAMALAVIWIAVIDLLCVPGGLRAWQQWALFLAVLAGAIWVLAWTERNKTATTEHRIYLGFTLAIAFIPLLLILSIESSRPWVWAVALMGLQACVLWLIASRGIGSRQLKRKRRSLVRFLVFGWVIRLEKKVIAYLMEHERTVQLAAAAGGAGPPAHRRVPDVKIISDITYFDTFIVLGAVALGAHVLANALPHFASQMGPLAIALTGLAVLLIIVDMGRFLRRLYGLPFFLIIIPLSIGLGWFFDPHLVRTSTRAHARAEAADRAHFDQKLLNWAHAHAQVAGSGRIPMAFVMAQGGASRSGYWVASMLDGLDAASNGGFGRSLFCLSGASGGSVGISAYYSALVARDTSLRKVPQAADIFEHDLLSHAIARLLGADLVNLAVPNEWIGDRAGALERSMEEAGDAVDLDLMKRSFHELCNMAARAPHQPVLCLNTVCMQDARPGLLSTLRVDDLTFNGRIDVLELLPPDETISLATAAVLSSRFPYVSPAGGIQAGPDSTLYFVDGGYIDNSGAGVVLEMLMRLEWLKHNHPDSALLRRLDPVVLELTNGRSVPSYTAVLPVINDLGAPFKTLFGSYGSQTRINGRRVERFVEYHYGEERYVPVDLMDRCSRPDPMAMSWALSRTTQARVQEAVLRALEREPSQKLLQLLAEE